MCDTVTPLAKIATVDYIRRANPGAPCPLALAVGRSFAFKIFEFENFSISELEELALRRPTSAGGWWKWGFCFFDLEDFSVLES